MSLMLRVDYNDLFLIPGYFDGYWLIACEESGTIRDAFLRARLDAVSCDLKASRSPSGAHYRGDVRDILYLHKWAGIIAHPDCTYLTLAGVRWLFDRAPSTPRVLKGPERWKALFDAAAFFNLFRDHPCERICIENPIMHGYAQTLVGGTATQYVQPYEYGHLETKKTGLRLKGLPPLVPTNDVEAEMRKLPKCETHRVHYCSPSEDRAEIRSVSYVGIGEAMAAQWGRL